MNDVIYNYYCPPVVSVCPKCGGYIYYSGPSVTHINWCNCAQQEPAVGWRCPICGVVNAPTRLTCDCSPKVTISTEGTDHSDRCITEESKDQHKKCRVISYDRFIDWMGWEEHHIWSQWMKHLFKICRERMKDEDGPIPTSGAIIIPKDLVERWERQIETDYYKLSDEERCSDKRIVEEYHQTIMELLNGEIEVDFEKDMSND